jgi:HD-GYP domain-containing protein (c-di-GMP phosphodiesterase class II)
VFFKDPDKPRKKRNKPASITIRESHLKWIPVSELSPGMYVAELDIPWEKSPFLFQGFKLENWDDVDAVINCCKEVKIDEVQSEKIRLPRTDRVESAIPFNSRVNHVSTKSEVKRATNTYNNASKLVTNIMDDIRLGKAIDTKAAKEVVSDAVDSMIRTPDAMMMLTRIKDRDAYTAQHSMNVAVLTIAFGRALGMERERLEELGVCGLLHDMGKVLTPIDVLNKEGKLELEEFMIMKKHPTDGRDILASSGGLFPGAMDVAHGHHERLDGSGYPRGLYGHQTTLWTKVVAITDAFDAITSDRCYKDGRSNMDAFRILNKERGTHFDSNLVMRFIGAIGIYPPGSIVLMNSGESGVVIETNANQALLPTVLLLRDKNDQVIEPRLLDLTQKIKVPDSDQFYKIVNTLRPSNTSIDLHELKDKGFLLDAV